MRGEALIAKAEVLRNILRELWAAVQKFRRTRNDEMIQKDPTASSPYKKFTENAMGDKVEARALRPEASLQCKYILRRGHFGGESWLRYKFQTVIHIRKGLSGTKVASAKLPIDAANKALRIGKVKAGRCTH